MNQISRRWRAERAHLSTLAALEAVPLGRGVPDVSEDALARSVDAGLAADLRGDVRLPWTASPGVTVPALPMPATVESVEARLPDHSSIPIGLAPSDLPAADPARAYL